MATAKQVDFLLSGYRHPTTNRPLAGGKIETYLDGTSTLSALWTDSNKGGVSTNPVILDSAGKAEVYGDNIYKFRIYESDDTFIEEITGLEYENISKRIELDTIADLRIVSGSSQNETILVLGYDAVGDGGGGPLRYWSEGQPPGTYTDDGGSIIVPTGGDGSAAWLMNDINGTLCPEWWGAVGNGLDTVPTDDSVAVKNAIIYSDGKEVFISRNYLVSIDLTDEKINLVGPGGLVQKSGSSEALSVTRTPGSDISITNISDIVFTGDTLSDYTKTQKITPSTVVDINSSDVFLLSSEDFYTWDNTVTQAELFKVLRLGLSYTNGSLNYGDVVTGNTSGAIFTVLSSNATDVTFSSFNNKDIINGEDLYVSGVKAAEANSVIYILPSQPLTDTYTTNIIINKVPQIEFIYKTGIEANGNIDDLVGLDNRRAAIRLDGVYCPIVTSYSITSWRAGVRLQSCWQGEINISIKKLSNDANSSESGFGYGVRADGATHGTNITIQGGYCRHGVTSNTTSNVLTNIWLYGTSKYINVHDSIITGSFAAAFDTHPGSYYWTFSDCIAISTSSLSMEETTNIGFNNRGFGTEYNNCIARKCTVGFNDSNLASDSGFNYETKYINCISDRYGYRGFLIDSFPTSAEFGKVYYRDCEAIADASIDYNLPFVQVGFQYSHALVDVEYNSCISRNSNSANFQIGNGKCILRNILIDMNKSISTNVESIRIDNNIANVTIDGLTVIPDTTNNEPESLIRYSGTTDTTIKISGSISCPGARTTPILRTTSTGKAILETVNYNGQDVVVTVSSNLNINEVLNTQLTNYGMTVTTETELYPYHGRTEMLLVVEAAGQTWRLEPPPGEAFLLDGVLLDVDDEILCGNVIGDSARLVRYKKSASTFAWALYTIKGSFTDVGP